MIFKEYLRLEKIKRLHKVRQDLFTDFNISVHEGFGFTRSEMFHFVVIDGKKYVHKESMRFILTNGYTYNTGLDPDDEIKIKNDPQNVKFFEDNSAKMFQFYREEINTYPLYPKFLRETENFFIFEYYERDWENIDHLTKEDSRYIKKNFARSFRGTKEVITPFYNQMANKIVKNRKTGQLVMVDLKRLEFHQQGDLAIYMYNGKVNDLYLLDRRFVTRKKLIAPFIHDYPVEKAVIHKHYDWF